ncbi:FUSC family protein [Desertihabitans brevis]|uniref:FUSC family protein n=1 Tax=Desertihabitans brevis TaxID=2268447 RepID=UPI0011BDECDD|nr:FUSC family protein [Desertihabitans brevis]
MAAVVAWLLGQLVPPPLADYPYYAPLGAVISTGFTVVSSVREAVRTVLAVLLGAGVAALVDLWLGPGVLALGVVVAVSTVLAGWRAVAGTGTWVATSAIFVLILGNADPQAYVGAYAGLIALGALVGIGVNLLLPPLPLSVSERELTSLGGVLADQLRRLADGLGAEQLPTAEEWQDRRLELEPVVGRARESVATTQEARRGNWLARWWAERSTRQTDLAHRLEIHARVVDVLTLTVTEQETRDAQEPALGPRLRTVVADALGAYADALDRIGTDTEPPDLDALDAATSRLREEVREVARQSSSDSFSAASVAVSLERGRRAFGEEDVTTLGGRD